MTYNVFGGTLSLTQSIIKSNKFRLQQMLKAHIIIRQNLVKRQHVSHSGLATVNGLSLS